MNTDVNINTFFIRPETEDDEFEFPYYVEYAVSGGGYGGEDDTWVDIIWEEFATYEKALECCSEHGLMPSAIKKVAKTVAALDELDNCGNYPTDDF